MQWYVTLNCSVGPARDPSRRSGHKGWVLRCALPGAVNPAGKLSTIIAGMICGAATSASAPRSKALTRPPIPGAVPDAIEDLDTAALIPDAQVAETGYTLRLRRGRTTRRVVSVRPRQRRNDSASTSSKPNRRMYSAIVGAQV